MSDDLPTLTEERRARLVAVLEERARLLAPAPELINRALRRCVRHGLRFSKRTGSGSGEATPAAAAGILPALPVAPALAGVPAPPRPYTASEPTPATLFGLPTTEPPPGAPPIASAVAQAQTFPEEQSQLPVLPVHAGGGVAPPPLPAVPAPPPVLRPVAVLHALPAGRQLGGYRIEALLGTGGMGQVYRATQLSMNREVALKVLLPRYTRNPRFRERFLREARAAGRLHHPNLIAVHDVGEADGLMYFSMELVEGSTVREVIGELATVPEERAFDICRQVLEALRYAHERGIVHRDIKPDNLMLMVNGTVKVADLGLSRVETPPDEDESYITQTGTMMGTPYYMPPEQGRDAHRADHRADLYALGATLYHMVCGRVPFEGETAVAILINATTQPLVFPQPGPGSQMRQLITRCMAKKPLDRPQSAADALALLASLRAGDRPARASGSSARMTAEGTRSSSRLGSVEGGRPSERIASARMSGRHKARPRPSAWPWLVAALLLGGALAGAYGLLTGNPTARLRHTVAERVRGENYLAALGLIAEARLEVPPGRRADELARLAQEIEAQWNAWAMARCAAVFAGYRADADARRLVDAEQRLAGIPPAQRSPQVLAEIGRREQELEDLRTRDESQSDRRQRVQRLVDQWWDDAIEGGASEADGTVRFAGSGRSALRPLPSLAGGRLPIPLELVATFAPAMVAADASWWLALAPGRRLLVRPGGLFHEDGTGLRRLAEPGDGGRVRFVLTRARNELIVQVRESAVERVVLRVPGDGLPTVAWSLPAGCTAAFQARALPAALSDRREAGDAGSKRLGATAR